MHDIRLIRDDPAAFDAAMKKRGYGPLSHLVEAFYSDQNRLKAELDNRRQERKRLSEMYRGLAAAGQSETFEARKTRDKSVQMAKSIADLEKRISELPKVQDYLSEIPNAPADDVPLGNSEQDNKELEDWGARRIFDFHPKSHDQIGEKLGLEFDVAAKMSGSRFSFLRGSMARLHRALGQFMLDRHVNAGFVECNPPVLVSDDALYGTAQLPKFKGDLFSTSMKSDYVHKIRNLISTVESYSPNGKLDDLKKLILDDISWIPEYKDRRWLIPTAEVSLTNSVRDSIIQNLDEPIRLTALTPCFRSEAGAAGRDTKGLIRQHQFDKVELVTICRPHDSQEEHEKMSRAAESVLHALNLPFRKMLLCAGDMGFAARKTYDLEVWLPGQDAYREISSISNCGDFQARRMNARFRPAGEKATQFVHTLNGSGLAVGRTLVAVLENYQQEDGSVHLPEVLHGYMGGVTRLVPS